jgi:menaquinone-specific isochorismate synthase
LFHLVSSAKKIRLPLGQSPKNEIHLPNKKRWFSHISDLKHIFAKQDLRKLVLSRQSHSKVQNVWDMFRSIVTDHPNCYHFLFSPQPNHVFLGCSPEKLFSVKGNVLHTEALAGTRPRGGKGVDDIKLDKELRHSNKDLNEHHIVTSYILSVLQDHSRNIEVLPQRVLRLKHVQHLQTPIKATLSDDFSLDTILHSLHPTPAVCGYPRKVAQRKIKEMEPFSRGWYSGTIGIIHRGSADFTVAIRSALAIENDLYIWTGAGIVNNSVASEEWREINIKGKPFFDLAK